MLTRVLVIASLLAGCSGKSEAPATGAATESLGMPFVPDAIGNQLAGANVIIAIDLAKFGLSRFEALIPEPLSCVRELLGKVGVVVLGSGDAATGFVTGMPEKATKDCVGALAPLLGATPETKDGVYRVTAGGDAYAITWKGDVTTIVETAKPPKGGPPDARMRGLIGQVPKAALGWVVSGGFPNYKIKESVAWLEDKAPNWHLVVTAVGSEPGAAKTWLEGIPKGFKQGAAAKGIVVEDSWFEVTGDQTSARLEGKIPTRLFENLGRQ